MLNFKPILSIAKKELISFFNSSMGYVLIVPFLLITFFLFFRSAYISNQASLRPFFDLLPFVLLLFAPAIAMRTFAQEQKNKTLELLYAHPITEAQIVLGKFLGSLGFFGVMLATTITLPITTFIFANPDPGVVISQYLGAIFVGGAFLAIGIAASTLTNSQVSSFLLAAAVSFAFILIGFDFVLLSAPSFLANFMTQVAILPHMNNLSRGVLDLRDLLCFVTIIGIFLTIAVIRLSQRKTVENPVKKHQLNLALGILVAIGIVANILMYSYPLRLDLTFNRLFTLSQGTKQSMNQLPDVVSITLFTSKNLPGPVQANVQKINDTLKDYERLGKGKIKVVQRYPDTSQEDLEIAQERGIQQIQFNTLANNSYAVAAGFLGLDIAYGDQHETIPFVQNIDDLEYQLTRRIRKLTLDEQPSIAIFTRPQGQFGQEEKSIEILKQALATQYEVTNIALDQPESTISAQTLLVYGLQDPLSATASAKISDFINSQGRAIFLIENHQIDAQNGTAAPFKTGFEEILSQYGVTANQDIVYDTRLNETIALGAGGVQYLLPYPFWIKALPADPGFPASSGVQSVSMAWPNSFSLKGVKDVIQSKLLQTSPNGGKQEGIYNLAPDKLEPENFAGVGEEVLVAVAVQQDNKRLAVVGDSEFITDEFMRSPGNLSFASGLVDWVGADEALALISKKVGDFPVFSFSSTKQAMIVQYVNIFLPSILVAGFGFWYLARRKKLTNRIYKA